MVREWLWSRAAAAAAGSVLFWGCSSAATGSAAPAAEADEQMLVTAERPASWQQTPIVFRSDRGSRYTGDLYLMAADGSQLRRLTTGGDFYFPEWSPTGESIACRRLTPDNHGEVALVGADGSAPVLLTQGEATDLYATAVNWSPDAQRLAFASSRDGDMKMWVSSRSGSGQELMLPNVVAATDGIWSVPDASRVAYSASPEAAAAGPEHGLRASRDLWVAPTDGSSEPINLTQGRVYAPSFLRWSPDGKRIAFSAFALSPDGRLEGYGDHTLTGQAAPDDEIYIVDVASAELTRLTDNQDVDQVPAWSPDGKALLITSYRDGDGDIWLLPIDAPEQAVNLIDDGAFSNQEDYLADWYWNPASPAARGEP